MEEGTYAVPFSDRGTECRREITAQELGALLSGIDLSTDNRANGELTLFRLHGSDRCASADAVRAAESGPDPAFARRPKMGGLLFAMRRMMWLGLLLYLRETADSRPGPS